jgi:hypothetical protein
MLEFIARRLGELNDEVVYLGGCTTALFITDPLSLDVRPTRDVDCIVDLVSLPKYYEFGEKLKIRGFKESMNEDVMCRWRCEDAILDIIPTDEDILKFGNQWYRKAIQNPITHQLDQDLAIKSVTAPYLLATKIDAFKSRGDGDFLGSHDFEDLITVIAGRAEIVDEIEAEGDALKFHLREFFDSIITNTKFQQALPGHLNDGPITLERMQMVIRRLEKIIAIGGS